MWKWFQPSYVATLCSQWRLRWLTSFYDWRFPNAGNVPTANQWVYAEGQLHLSHGEDDFAGGVARVKRVEIDANSRVWVEFEEQPGTMHNWEFLGPRQNQLRALYGKSRAHADPDHRPEFNRWD